jgi:DNA polymerase III subunit gamma/tau
VVPGLPDDESYDAATLDGFAARVPAEDLQLYYQIAILGRRDLPLAPEPRGGAEMVLLRMLAFRPAEVGGAIAAPPPRAAAAAAATAARSSAALLPAGTDGTTAAVDLSSWQSAVQRLDVHGAARQLAAHCEFVRLDGDTLCLRLDARGEGLKTRAQEERLAQSVARLAGRPLRLVIEVSSQAGETPARQQERDREARLEQARSAIDNDPTVRALKDRFGAVVQPDSVKPVG